jgi:phosphatidylserine/phosphatidylglycerophosphate/cardiolipin synthase-like enzyme
VFLTGCQATTSSEALQNGADEGITLYFNDPLAGFPSMDDWEAQANGLDRALIGLIDSAQQSLDIAVYHLTLPAVMEALYRACGRGVRVRLVTESEQSRPNRLPGCVELRLDRNGRAMHDKFMIVDGQTVWTGSANWTANSFYYDANDALIMKNMAIAGAYETEFKEMFVRGRYGPQKRDLSEERFTVGGVPVEVYFGPSDRPRARLIELLENAKDSIRIALFTLTDDEVYGALEEARGRGVSVDAVWDFTGLDGCLYADVDELLGQGVGVLDALPGLLHHKYAVIDDRLVITGSTNWSKSGFDHNDENLLVILDEGIAERYIEDFAALRDDAREYNVSTEEPPRVEIRHFDVARGAALLQWRPRALGILDRYEICRLRDPQGAECERVYEAPGWAWYFVDRDVLPGEEHVYRVRAESQGRWTDYSNPVRARAPKDIPLLTADEAKRELARYAGKIVTVRFRVMNQPKPVGRAGHVYLNASEDYRTDFTAFIPACALARFNGSGLDLLRLQGRTVEVTGELREYNGPEIMVTGPWQVFVLPEGDG